MHRPTILPRGRWAMAPRPWKGSPSVPVRPPRLRPPPPPSPASVSAMAVNATRAPRGAPSASARRPRLAGPPLPAGLLEHLLVLVLAHGLAPFLDDRAHESLSMRAAIPPLIRQ